MRECVRGIVIKNDSIVLIHRIKEIDGERHEYYVFPGGGIEAEETHDDTVKREVLEEVGIIVEPKNEVYRLEKDNAIHYFVLCEYVSGKIGTGTGPEFYSEEYSNMGEFIPEMIKLEDLSKIKIKGPLAEAIQEDILKYGNLENTPFRDITYLEK